MRTPPAIALDGRKWADFGIGTYVRTCLRNLLAGEAPAPLRLLLPPGVDGPREDPRLEVVRVAARGYGLAEHVTVARAARGSGLLHVPHYVLPLAWRGPSVVTVHDLIHLRFPEFFGPLARGYARAMIGSACRRADLVLTVSETVRGELIERFGLPARRVRVVPNEVHAAFFRARDPGAAERLDARLTLPARYVVAAGNHKPHKDLPRLVEALARVVRRPGLEDVGLVLAGGSETGDLLAAASARGLVATALPSLPVEELAEVLRRATLLAHPSRHEGFGLPVAEALAAGTAVLCSDGGALPEVGGDAVLCFPAGDVDGLEAGLARLLEDEELRGRLARAGPVRAARYAPGSAREALLAAYRDVLAGQAQRED